MRQSQILPITAIIPTFNRPELCLKALESICAQTSRPAEIIVVDDGSTKSLDDVRDLLKQNRGVYLRQENLGVAAARNLGIRCAQQEWIAFLDSDDQWLPNKLEQQFRIHQTDCSLMISHTAEIWIRNGKQVFQKSYHQPAEGDCFERCLEICCISASSVIIKTELLKDFGGFDTDFLVCEDYDLWVRLTKDHRVGLIKEPLVIKFRGDSQQLSDSVQAVDRYRVQALIKLLSIELTKLQRNLVKEVLKKKLLILEKGAKKRELNEELRKYQDIRDNFNI